MIDSKYLKLIVAIDQYGSLNKASNELHLSQSALSHQLKNLEEMLGLDVFLRIGNQLHFTEAGKELRDKAKSILEALDKLEWRMNEIKKNQLHKYIHGYNQREVQRLEDQASTVADYLHHDSYWPAGSSILEIGCGIGAQTEIIAPMNPQSQFVSIDISTKSIEIAKAKIKEQKIDNVQFIVSDANLLSPKKNGMFDHVFICFLLEHLPNPSELLNNIKSLIKPGGTITIIEGDHGSTFFFPDNQWSNKMVEAQVKLQQQRGGNANIGRTLYPILDQSGYQKIHVSPRQIYVDNSKPELVEGFIKNTFTAMIQGMSEDLLKEKLLTIDELKEGLVGLLRTTEKDGMFSYTFFKAVAHI